MNLKIVSTALVAVLVSIGVVTGQNRAAKPADAVKGHNPIFPKPVLQLGQGQT